MGFFTIWSSFIVIFFVINFVFIIVLELKTKAIFISFYIYTFISFLFYIFICFFYHDFFLYFLIVKTSTTFFISDPNVLAYHLFQNSIFFCWVIFLPIILINTLLISQSFLMKEEYFVYKRYVYIVVYTHCVSFFIRHFDLFRVYQSYFGAFHGFMFEGVDFSSYVNFYWRTYIDLFYVVIFINIILYIVFENFRNISILLYFFEKAFNSIISSKQNYWISFFFSIIIRAILNRIIIYFFIGEGFQSDFFIISCTVIFVEFVLFIFRFFIVRSTWKGM